MSYWRGQLDLAIPKKVWDAIPLARKIAFRDEVRAMQALSVKINEGKDNEEMTVRLFTIYVITMSLVILYHVWR